MEKDLIDSLASITGIKLSDMLGKKENIKDKEDYERSIDLEEMQRDYYFNR